MRSFAVFAMSTCRVLRQVYCTFVVVSPGESLPLDLAVGVKCDVEGLRVHLGAGERQVTG